MDATTPRPEAPDAPRCEQCGYSFAGRASLTRCPECGTSLLEMLGKRQKSDELRFRSSTMIGSWPLYDIVVHPGTRATSSTARGIIASGPSAIGLIAVGGRAMGVVAIGGFSLGLFAMGGISVGLCTAFAGVAIGTFAFGGVAAGVFCMGGVTAGIALYGGMRFSIPSMLGWAPMPGMGASFRRWMDELIGVAIAVPVLASIANRILIGVLNQRRKAALEDSD